MSGNLGKGWITLNVGGKLMTTTRSTLTKDKDSVLYKMFYIPEEECMNSNNPFWNPEQGARDENGAYLLDSNPKFVITFSIDFFFLFFQSSM